MPKTVDLDLFQFMDSYFFPVMVQYRLIYKVTHLQTSKQVI